MPSEAITVTDDSGVEFTLGTRIAEGGQGTVYRVERYPELAIKLLTRPSDLERIRSVRRLPLDDLPVAAPVTLIQRGGVGYVMRLASEMRPLSEPYLPREFGPRETNRLWYEQTGGLRRRLAIAANTADTLAALHALGLAYVDLNPNNVMVSEDLTRDVTWLIDCDNLTSMSVPDWDVLGFPGFLAPERAHRAPPSTLSDAYVLAVHVFKLLVLRHPMEGAAADALEGKEARFRMDRGELAYVADPDDDSNRLAPRLFSGGILPLVLSARLRKLCQQTFIAGRHSPASRPGAARWRESLFKALDNVVECAAGCGWTFYRLRGTCPSCGAVAAAPGVLSVYGGDFEQPLPERDAVVLSTSGVTHLLPRHLWGRYDEREPLIAFRPDGRGFAAEVRADAGLTDGAGRPVNYFREPEPGRVTRARLDVPGRPSRTLALRTVSAS